MEINQEMNKNILILLQPPLNRTLSDPSHDKQSLVDELLAIPMAAVQQAEEFVKKVISAGWRVVSHRALPDWLQVRTVYK